MRENRLLYNAYQFYKYLVFFPLLGMGTTFIFIMIFTFLFVANERFVQIAGIIWARFNSFITPMFVTVKGEENIERSRSYVVVANHQSQYDIFVIYGWLPIDFRWVMKIELRKVPILGYYCYKAGHIFIDRSNREASIRTINEAKAKITNGTSVLFFPEGTRSETGQLIEFKKGAFKFALDMGLPVLPITIIGTREILPDNSIGLFPGSATMIIHKPIEIEGYSDDSIDGLIDRAREAIQSGLDRHPG
ncbi:MAG: 1-acyl-sn-glycerol-3-phosphate acyltransferase [Spirochaetes bacterium]|nr:1-acyl-sn-glycerol-3-phosphate acyltransferase [Spirochaetota bacterium]